MTLAGFPHSGISGSKPASGYPELNAANHALHRLLAPRHPPYALSSLTHLPLANAILILSVNLMFTLPDCQRTTVLPTVTIRPRRDDPSPAARTRLWWRIPGSNR